MASFAEIVANLQASPITAAPKTEKPKTSDATTPEPKKGFQVTNDILPILNRSVVELVPPPTEHTPYRISSIPHLCAREEVLCAIHKVTRKDEVPMSLRIIFDFGHKIHDMMQNELLGPERMLSGDWMCMHCETVEKNSTLPQACKKCGCKDASDFRFIEEEVTNKEMNYVGHPDGDLVVTGKTHLLEMKSINGNAFEYLKEPYEAHVEQAMLYAFLKKRDSVKIVYVNKNGGGKRDFFKEYTGAFDQSVVDGVHARLNSIRTGIRDSVLPERTVCITPTSVRAKKCPVRKQCFAEEKE